MLNCIGINGKITVSFYLFFNFLINYLLIRLFGFFFTVMILLFLYVIDITFYTYLFEEKANKSIEIILSIIIMCFL